MWEPARHAEHSELLVRRMYRRRQPTPTEWYGYRSASHRALSDVERQEVLDLLHSQRFVDQAPAQVAAALLDEERYLCSARTMYRILDANEEVREPADFTNAVIRPIQTGAVGHGSESGVELGYYKAQGAAEVDLLLPVHS